MVTRKLSFRTLFPLRKLEGRIALREREIITLIQTVNAFCESPSISAFRIDGHPKRVYKYSVPSQRNLLRCVIRSNRTLKILHLGSCYKKKPERALQFILSCPNLEDLSL